MHTVIAMTKELRRRAAHINGANSRNWRKTGRQVHFCHDARHAGSVAGTTDGYSPLHSKSGRAKKYVFSKQTNLISDNYGGPARRQAGLRMQRRARGKRRLVPVSERGPLSATMLFYVSDPRPPVASSSPCDHCAARPGLNRFCKSNERMPAAVTGGLFYCRRAY